MIINFCFEDELLNFDLFRDVIGTTSRAFPDVLVSMAYRRPFGYKKTAPSAHDGGFRITKSANLYCDTVKFRTFY